MRGIYRIKQDNIEAVKKSGNYDPVNDLWPGDPGFEEQEKQGRRAQLIRSEVLTIPPLAPVKKGS